MFKAIAACSALLLCGCSSGAAEYLMYGESMQVKPFLAPDGRQAYSLNCIKGVADCHDRARKACGGNYDVLGQSRDATYDAYDPISRTGGDVTTTHLMQVACAK